MSSEKLHSVTLANGEQIFVSDQELYDSLTPEAIERAAEQLRQKILVRDCLMASTSNSCCPPPLPSNECSLNSALTDVVPTSDVVIGMRPGGRMSVVRRFFCLFVTFDLLFTVLMWLICIMLISEDVFKMMSKQVVHYNIHTSLFDIVMAAAVRFVVLLLFYALLYIKHWGIVALSTAGTCAFLISKVFLYDWIAANSPVFQVLLILTSFVLVWGEAWFLDFRVIPQEVLAHNIVESQCRLHNERTPLLQPYLQHLQARHDDQPESVRNFYSPMDSQAGSDDEELGFGKPATSTPKRPTPISLPYQQVDSAASELCSKGQEMLWNAWETLCSSGWRKEKEDLNGDKIDSRPRPNGGRQYRLEGDVATTPDILLNLLYNKIDEMPKWNPTVILARRLEIIDEQTDISYQVMAEGGKGLFASRDFVTLRRWEFRGRAIVVGSESITHPAAPPTRKPIRAEQGPSCFVLEPSLLPGHTHLRWLIDTDLKGWIPQALLDQAYASAMTQWIGYLRKHLSALNHPEMN